MFKMIYLAILITIRSRLGSFLSTLTAHLEKRMSASCQELTGKSLKELRKETGNDHA